MTVAQLIEELKKLPPTAKVTYPDGEYQDSEATVTRVTHREDGWLGSPGNTVVLS